MNTNYKNENENDLEKNLECCSSVDSTHSGDITDDYIGSDCLDFENAGQELYPSELDRYELNDGNMIYNPSELMLRPPSSSDMHFNYNYPAILPPQSRITNNNNAALQSNFCGTPIDMLSNNLPESADTSKYSKNSHVNSGNCHPNMWYPNSSFSSNKSYRSRTTYGADVPNDQMMNMFQLSNSSREARNLAEKNRRNKLNCSIQELSRMVPHVAESPRRVDKTAVLRFAAHGLRLQYVFGKSIHKTSIQITDSLMKLLDSFFLTLTCNGQIVLVSSSIEQHLGHCQTDLYGQNILNIIHPEDQQIIKEKLIPTDLDNLLDIGPENENGERIRRTQAEKDEIDRRLRQDKRSFTIRMAKSGPKSDPTIYEVVKIDGSFRRSDMSSRGAQTTIFSPTVHLMRRSKCREEIMPLHTISNNDIVLIAVARVIRPPPVNRSLQVNNMEYKTRHLIDGRIVDCDQNISLVAGYMTDEVRNLSPFTFIHQYDVRWVIVALRQMYDCNSSFGESTYRLFTRNGQIIYLHTKGFLEMDKNTNKVHSFICVNTMLDEEEGKRRIQNMKNKFSVIINSKIPESLEDVPASENPQQLEKAVMCLIKNLKSDSIVNDDFDGDYYGDDDIDTTNSDDFASTSFSTKSHYHANPYQKYLNTSPNMGRSTKTPPLDLVPPATDSIKSSISKSVNVVKTTAGKFLRSTGNICEQQHQQIVHDSNECSPNPHTYNQLPNDIEDIIYTQNTDNDMYLTTTSDQEVCPAYTSSSALKRKITYSPIESDSDEYSVPMQRQAIESVLSNSLQQINNRLTKQLNTAMELREQGQHYEVPDTEERLADIMINDSQEMSGLNDLSYSCNDSLNDYLEEDNTLQLNKEDSGNEFDDIINYEEYENNLDQTESLTDDTSAKNSPNTGHIFISQKYKCQICNRRYTTERLLKVHLNYHRRRNVGSKPYSCKICGEQFSLQRYLTQHMIDHQDCREIHKCQYCSKEYVTKTALISHKRVHQGETLNCTECGKQFNGTYEFRVHLRFHKREKEQGIYKCEICNKEYSLRRYLSQHMYAHHKDRKTHKCDYCNKEYVNKTTLNNHKRLHEGQTTKCNVCGKEFTRNCELKIHMRFHKQEHPFKCTMCEKKFTIKGHLKAHMWRHQGIKLECQECGKLFGSTKALKEHSYTHGEMPYPCEFCNKAYPSKQKYKLHLQKVHDSEGGENVEKSLNTQNIKRNKVFTYVQVTEEP